MIRPAVCEPARGSIEMRKFGVMALIAGLVVPAIWSSAAVARPAGGGGRSCSARFDSCSNACGPADADCVINCSAAYYRCKAGQKAAATNSRGATTTPGAGTVTKNPGGGTVNSGGKTANSGGSTANS